MLTFAYPHFLWGLLALAGPILLHLLNRTRPRRLIFPSIRFLQLSPLPREGRRRLRDITLLLCRMALFAAIVLALARPQWVPKSRPVDGSALQQAIVLLDSSASLHWQGAAEKSRNIALSALTSHIQDGWQTGLTTYSRDLLAEYPPGSSLQTLQTALAEWEPTLSAGRPEQALSQCLAAFNPGAKRKKLLLISDFQSSDWALQELTLERDIELEFLPLDSLQPDNVGILSVQCTPLAGNKQRVLVLCRNYSPTAQQRLLSVRLGQQSQSNALQLEGGQSQRAAFVFELQEDSAGPGWAGLSHDIFPPDDEYYFWAGAEQPVKVLLITPDDGGSLSEDEVFFVSKALSAEKDGLPGRFTWERLGAASLFAADLQSCQIIFLLGSAERLSQDSWEKLTAFLANGGAIFHTPGQSPALGWHALREYGLSRSQYQGMLGKSSHDSSLGLSWVAPDSPLGQIFIPESSDLFLFPIRSHARLQPHPTERILLQTLDGLPALLEIASGNGRLYSFAFAFNLSWSDFPLSQSFLPLLRELCADAVPPQHGRKRIACGTPVPKLYRLDGSEILPVSPIDSSRPGAFLLGDCPVEINLDAREALPETVKTADLQRFLQRDREMPASHSATALAGSQSGERPLWQYCLFLMALLILLEAVLTTTADARKGKGG